MRRIAYIQPETLQESLHTAAYQRTAPICLKICAGQGNGEFALGVSQGAFVWDLRIYYILAILLLGAK